MINFIGPAVWFSSMAHSQAAVIAIINLYQKIGTNLVQDESDCNQNMFNLLDKS